ncbi:MAG: hypothetical protein QM537_08090 [Candidatus Symbiobacter sp.]|nr:hypothetical protein [Candidatus Symbiobacter sp.]
MTRDFYRMRTNGMAVKRGLRHLVDRMFFNHRSSPEGFLLRSPQRKAQYVRGRGRSMPPRLVAANVGLVGLALVTVGVFALAGGEMDGFVLLLVGFGIFIATFGVMLTQIFNLDRLGRGNKRE